MMHMTFYWGRKVTLLFDSWKTESWASYGLTLLACFLFASFYQYMEDRRHRIQLLSLNNTVRNNFSSASSPQTPLLVLPKLSAAPARFAGTVLFGVNAAVGYLLMLAIMSFNGGVFIAVVLGLAVGYFLFRSGDIDVVVAENPCACA